MSELPDRPDLDHLRDQARDLIRAARAGDAEALDRLRAVSGDLKLVSAQLAIAREYGYPSWAAIKKAVEHRTRAGSRAAPLEPTGSSTVEANGRADPEAYLRRLAEREMLADESRETAPSGLSRVAAGFVAARVLDRLAADRIVADCARLAGEWGRSDVGHDWVPGPPRTAPLPVAPSRFVPGPIDVVVPWGDLCLRWLRLTDDRTDIAVVGHNRAFRPGVRRRPPQPHPTLEVSDDRGTTTTFSFSGRGGDDLVGTFTAGVPLCPDTAWLDFYGRRVELHAGESLPHEVRIEHSDGDAATSFLWHELALWGPRLHRPGRVWEPDGKTVVLEGLVAVGALGPTDPELSALRWASGALAGSGTGKSPPSSLPPIWRSMLAQRLLPPPASLTGVFPLGAVARFADAVVAVEAIDARADGMSIEVCASPPAALCRRHGSRVVGRRRPRHRRARRHEGLHHMGRQQESLRNDRVRSTPSCRGAGTAPSRDFCCRASRHRRHPWRPGNSMGQPLRCPLPLKPCQPGTVTERRERELLMQSILASVQSPPRGTSARNRGAVVGHP